MHWSGSLPRPVPWTPPEEFEGDHQRLFEYLEEQLQFASAAAEETLTEGPPEGLRRAWWPIARRGRRSRRSMRGSLWCTLGTKTCATRNHRRLRRLLAHQPAAQQHTEYGLRRTPISRFGGQDARFSLSIKRWEASQVVNTATSPGRETSPGYVIAQIR